MFSPPLPTTRPICSTSRGSRSSAAKSGELRCASSAAMASGTPVTSRIVFLPWVSSLRRTPPRTSMRTLSTEQSSCSSAARFFTSMERCAGVTDTSRVTVATTRRTLSSASASPSGVPSRCRSTVPSSGSGLDSSRAVTPHSSCRRRRFWPPRPTSSPALAPGTLTSALSSRSLVTPRRCASSTRLIPAVSSCSADESVRTRS
mmetsp:Transcript_23379/g.73313  ORF Transcript_23379/g.73313 Transcript_23379/m.73313 type:complete len:203 (+) Transcript_23379:1546-2154(+)